MNIENFLKKKGIVRDKKQANLVMIIFIIICFVVIIMITKKDPRKTNFDKTKLSPAEISLTKLKSPDKMVKNKK